VTISVCDDGAGISADIYREFSSPLFDGTSGSGLGLASAGSSSRMGRSISVSSDAGNGATVLIALRAARPEMPRAFAEPS
jgi:C4-dicarboxylate-specific signal transduction histidine kinase